MDAFSVDELRGKFLKKLQITYVKQCKMGEIIDITKKYEDGYYIVEGSVDGELRVQFKVEFDEV